MWEVLEKDDTLAAESASEEDEDCAGGEGLTRTGGVDGFADLDKGSLVVEYGCHRIRGLWMLSRRYWMQSLVCVELMPIIFPKLPRSCNFE